MFEPLAKKKAVGSNFKNEHPYVIGDCGGPVEKAKGPKCMEVICGLNHRIIEGNEFAIEIDDATLPANLSVFNSWFVELIYFIESDTTGLWNKIFENLKENNFYGPFLQLNFALHGQMT